MKIYPDYKYRPRRRKTSKMNSSKICHDVDDNHSLPRSNSFSKNFESNSKNYDCLCSSTPISRSYSASPESMPPSSPEDNNHSISNSMINNVSLKHNSMEVIKGHQSYSFPTSTYILKEYHNQHITAMRTSFRLHTWNLV